MSMAACSDLIFACGTAMIGCEGADIRATGPWLQLSGCPNELSSDEILQHIDC
jgi:hypothetical protein